MPQELSEGVSPGARPKAIFPSRPGNAAWARAVNANPPSKRRAPTTRVSAWWRARAGQRDPATRAACCEQGRLSAESIKVHACEIEPPRGCHLPTGKGQVRDLRGKDRRSRSAAR